jgi:hypothetical protein
LIGDATPLFYGLVDLMLAYAYEDRTTEGERNAESAWTLCKLSGTLSSLEVPPTLCTCLLLPSV